jgi:hypothetical protein
VYIAAVQILKQHFAFQACQCARLLTNCSLQSSKVTYRHAHIIVLHTTTWPSTHLSYNHSGRGNRCQTEQASGASKLPLMLGLLPLLSAYSGWCLSVAAALNTL